VPLTLFAQVLTRSIMVSIGIAQVLTAVVLALMVKGRNRDSAQR
jgi:hypothetical protein